MDRKERRKSIKDAVKEGNGANLRIPFSYHRIRKISSNAKRLSEKEIRRLKRRAKIRRKRLLEVLAQMKGRHHSAS